MGLTLSQQTAFKAYQNGLNLFITGKGGSGKSFLTSQIVASAKNDNKNVLVCAPTGLAALNVGGVTIHRQFRVAPGLITPEDSTRIIKSLIDDYTERMTIEDKRKDRGGRKNIMDVLVTTDIIVIDEISMCRCDLFTHVGNAILAANQLKKKVNENRIKEAGKNKKKANTLSPIQVIVVGDFYQLPPILTDKESAAFHTFYKSVFAFKSPMWKEIGIHTIELRESMRQKDQRFLSCLDSIREGDHPQLDVLKDCRNQPDNRAITLCGTNKQAHSINASQLAKLEGEEVEYKAVVSGKVEAGDWQCDPILKLKVGARVIMLSNDKDGRWINGSSATINKLTDDRIIINLDDDDHTSAVVERYTWSIEEVSVVEYKDKDDKVKKGLKSIVKAKIVQFPMKLSWAISIHKSQGQTFENLNVNIDNIFCDGQLYVALSRCKTLQGLHITGDVTEDKVMVSEEVKEFMTNPHGDKEKEAEQDHLKENTPENGSEKAGKSEYQHGWDDGYDYRSKEVAEERELENSPEAILSRINANAGKLSSEDLASVGLRRIPDRSKREHEKEALPAEARNPRGAGRPSQGHDQKALKVPVEIIETMRDLVKLYWNHKDAIRSELERIISGYLN